jgi:uncharacterized protein with PIN domain
MIATEAPAARPRTRRISALIERAVANPWIAYTAIAALQLRVIWNIWKYADLTSGDTSYYFLDAASWQHGLHENIVYYPFYDALWGTILAIVHSVYAATIIQRVAIIFAVVLLVLALMRALLGPALGLLIAAWWAIVPANYDVLYEVHLLGAVPILLAVLVVVRMPRRAGVGIAVAILLASAVLVRTELIAAAAILAAALAVYELRELRAGRRAPRSSYVRAYVVPLTLALLLIGGAYARSHVQGSEAWGQLQAKEEANFCNMYAAAYQEHHPALFTGNPFTECEPLMQHTFGRQKPSLLQASTANPRAVAGFAAWNARMTPVGLQIGLFGASAFAYDPGFRPVTESSAYVLLLSVTALEVVLAAVVLLARGGRLTPRRIPPRTRWIVLTVASVAAATTLVALTSRPWSEYIYGLSICSLIVIGASVLTVLRRMSATRFLAPLALATVLVLVLVLIVAHSSLYRPAPRPIYEGVEHLQVVQRRLQVPGSVLVTQENENEICNYLAYSYERYCAAMDWQALSSQVTAKESAGQVLDRAHATAVYADAAMLADPNVARLVADPGAQGWRQVARGNGLNGPWRVLIPLGGRS